MNKLYWLNIIKHDFDKQRNVINSIINIYFNFLTMCDFDDYSSAGFYPNSRERSGDWINDPRRDISRGKV